MTLYRSSSHRNYLLEDYGHGEMVQANQHLIVHGREGMILDPGGHKVFGQVLAETSFHLSGATLTKIVFSHQDPDIVAAANGWLMATDAIGYISSLWTRFVPHFGLDPLAVAKLKPIPDEGMWVTLDGCEIALLPAHFLHSPGNIHVYDPVSRILYSGDLGASLGMHYDIVTDFDEHVQYMTGFHRRYMASSRALRAWAAMVRTLDIETVAPQHGAMFRGPELVGRFIEWCESLDCGVDLIPERYTVPPRPVPV
jgi:flavorubredoxin